MCGCWALTLNDRDKGKRKCKGKSTSGPGLHLRSLYGAASAADWSGTQANLWATSFQERLHVALGEPGDPLTSFHNSLQPTRPPLRGPPRSRCQQCARSASRHREKGGRGPRSAIGPRPGPPAHQPVYQTEVTGDVTGPSRRHGAECLSVCTRSVGSTDRLAFQLSTTSQH